MGVGGGGRPVSGPAGVSDPDSSLRQVLIQLAFQNRELPRSLHDLQAMAVHHGNPGGIVAAILQAPQAFQQQPSCLARSDVADNAAHDEPQSRSSRPAATRASASALLGASAIK